MKKITLLFILIGTFCFAQTERYTYEFNTDAEGWEDQNVTSTVSGGILNVNPSATSGAKIRQLTYVATASNAQYVHIVYRNTSATNNQIRFQFRNYEANATQFFGTNVNINQSMSSFEAIDIDLSGDANWNTGAGTVRDFQLVFRNTSNGGNAPDADLIQIERIVFDNNPTLKSNSFALNTNFKAYPNPVNNVLTIDSDKTIKSITVYSLTGKRILDNQNILNNAIEVSNLQAGVYIAQIIDNNNNSSTVKFVKN